MLAAGAGGKTCELFQKAFSLGQDEKALNDSFHALHLALSSDPGKSALNQILSSNRLYIEKRIKLIPAWQEITLNSFMAEAVRADFAGNASTEGDQINQWIKEQTSDKINEIVPPGALSANTLMVLVNALYFDMPWDEQFTTDLTTQQTFYLGDNRVKTVPLMFKQHPQRYEQKNGFQIATLPYADGTFQFVVFVPDQLDGLPEVESQLTGLMLTECATLPRTEVRLSLPRITLSPPAVSLKQTLSAMGAPDIFSPGKADFTRMILDADRIQPWVDNIFHRTFIELDEDGTKAAAATAAVVRTKNGAPRAISHRIVKADRPFLFMIQHVRTGACLFLGRVTDPAPDLPSANTTNLPKRGLPKK